MTPIVIDLQGAKAVEAGFARLSDVFSDFRTVFERLGEKFFPMVRQRIDEGIPPPLSPLTEARKARLYGGPSQILIATRQLYESFSTGSSQAVERIAPLSAEFGTSVFYAMFHQEGRGVPQRKIIDISPQQEAELAEEAMGIAGAKIRALGFEVV